MARDDRELKGREKSREARPREAKGRGASSLPGAAEEPVSPAPWLRTRLTTMPLAVLLPQLSDVGQIADFREELEERLRDVQSMAEAGESEDLGRVQVEQSMLQQVLQWLDVETDEG